MNPGDRPWPPDAEPRPAPPSEEQTEAFVRRCFLCHHWTLDAFESGVPIYSACRHIEHAPGRDPYPCLNLAHEYGGRRCPKFWPVILRAPHRIALRVVRDVLTR